MDVALENVRKRAAEGATQKTFCEISQAKGQSGKNVDQRRAVLIPFFHEFRFFRARTFCGVWLFSLFARMRRDWKRMNMDQLAALVSDDQ